MSSKDIEVQKKNEYGCSLFIDTFDDHPQRITDLLDLKASELIIKGSNWISPMTRRIIEGKVNKNNLWIFHVEKEYSDIGIYLNSPLEKMLNILDGKKEIVCDIFAKYSHSHLLCSAYYYETNPYFKLSKDLVSRLNDYQIDVEFDLYCLG